MIKIIDDWYITVDSYPTNYTVRRGEGEKDKKNGWKDKPYAFFGSLREAVKFIRGQIIAERLSTACTPLPDAIATISEVDARFEKLMEKIGV